MAFIKNIKRKFDDAIGIILGLVLMIMALLIVVSIIGRIAKGSIAWVEELVKVGVVWTTFLGSYVALAKNKDIRVDMLVKRLSPKPRLIVQIISDLFVLFFIATFTYFSVGYAAQFSSYRMPMTGLKNGLVYYVFPLGGGLMTIHYLLALVERVHHLFKKPAPASLEPGALEE